MTTSQMERLLREFPWLWAIQNFWAPDAVTVSFKEARENRFDIFRQRLSIVFFESVEIWVYMRSSRFHYQRIVRVEVGVKNKDKTLAEAVLSEIQLPGTSYDTAFVIFKSKPLESPWLEVYRDRSLVNFLKQAVNSPLPY